MPEIIHEDSSTMPIHWASRAHIAHGRPVADIIRDFAARGFGPQMIAQQLGCTSRTLRHWLAQRGIVVAWPSRSDAQRLSFRINPSRREAAAELMRGNRRNGHLIEYLGNLDTVAGHARRAGLSVDMVRFRISAGWTLDRSLTTPPISRVECGRLGARKKRQCT